MPFTSSVMGQRVSNFRLYSCSKKFQMLRKNVKSLLEQLQVCIFAEIVFGVRCTLNLNDYSCLVTQVLKNLFVYSKKACIGLRGLGRGFWSFSLFTHVELRHKTEINTLFLWFCKNSLTPPRAAPELPTHGFA